VRFSGPVILAFIALIIALSVLVIEFAYDGDYRCLVAECRIQK
jgi:hypothetical protein